LAGRKQGVCTGAGLLTAVAREVAKCKLYLIGVQEVRWNKGGTEQAIIMGMRIIN
jgi:hypothetical protein